MVSPPVHTASVGVVSLVDEDSSDSGFVEAQASERRQTHAVAVQPAALILHPFYALSSRATRKKRQAPEPEVDGNGRCVPGGGDRGPRSPVIHTDGIDSKSDVM